MRNRNLLRLLVASALAGTASFCSAVSAGNGEVFVGAQLGALPWLQIPKVPVPPLMSLSTVPPYPAPLWWATRVFISNGLTG